MKLEISKLGLLRIAEVAIVLSILVSGFILFAYERKNHDPDYNKSWVAFYFVDPNNPVAGVMAENHLGKDTDFKFCLVPDDDNLMEPNDLSCSLSSSIESFNKNFPAGSIEKWQYKKPEIQGKYWVVLEYKDGDVLKNKDLSFEIKN